jgi:hypothetical protein
MVLIAEKGFNLRGSMTARELSNRGPFTGKHTYDDAFLFVNDKGAAADLVDQPSVVDAGKLIKSLVAES